MSSITVNVTKLFERYAPNYVSASASELGPDAGRITWEHALYAADERDSWLVTNVYEACDTVRAWARETGAWDREEIEEWSVKECLALLAQNVAGDIRDHFAQDTGVDTDAVLDAYAAADAASELACGCHYYRASAMDLDGVAGALRPRMTDLMADWYA